METLWLPSGFTSIWWEPRFNFPGVLCLPQAWRGWRTSATPATWTPPCRPCPTGETSTFTCVAHITSLTCLTSPVCPLAALWTLWSFLLLSALFFQKQLLPFIHCLFSSCWIWKKTQTTITVLIWESDGWVKIAAVHHLRRQKWPFVVPCRVFGLQMNTNSLPISPPRLLFFSHNVSLYFSFYSSSANLLPFFPVYWIFIPSDSFYDCIVCAVTYIRAPLQSRRLYSLTYF